MFVRTRPGLDAPDVQLHFAPALFFDEGLTPPHDHAYTFGPLGAKPTSRGKVMLRAPLPDSKPRVLHNYLATEEDRQSMIAGVRIALEIAGQAPLQAVEREPFRVPDSDSDADILAFIRWVAHTVYHPTSTCAMGAVVDAELRVYGTESR